jgi:hypothetical protein
MSRAAATILTAAPSPTIAPMPQPSVAFHPRALLLVEAFGSPIHRASVVGSVAGIVAGSVAMYGLESAWWPVAAVVAIAATVVVGLAVAVVVLPTRVRRAFETFSWLAAREVDRLEERTGSKVPRTAADVVAWLDANPVSPITREARVEMLISLGRVAEARAELADLVTLPTSTPELARLGVAGSRAYAEIVETGGYDAAALEEALRTIPPGSDLALEADVVRAVTDARVRLGRGDPDALAPLVALRPALGRAATIITFRRTWLHLARSLATFGVAVALSGYVLRSLG